MSIISSSCYIAPILHIKQFKRPNPKPQLHCFSRICCSVPHCQYSRSHKIFSTRVPAIANAIVARDSTFPEHQSLTDDDDTAFYDCEDQEAVEDEELPWEGAIIYKRNPSITHVEYCTTLERLGLGKHSTEVSKSRASAMGLRVTKSVKDYPNGTPVQISIDVTKKQQKLRLDGIIRTVLTLGCNRCGEPAAESVFSNFSLLLSEQPIEEPEIIDIGTMFKGDKLKSSTGNGSKEEDDDASIDWDDRLYFPREEKEIDISKNIRDMVHLEITINVICDPSCKGICLKCGTNLNTSKCNCSNEEVKGKTYGPLGNLRKQMESR